jgi:hypothetical protein
VRKVSYKNRLKAVEEFGKWKCRQSIDKLWRLMISDKVYLVQNQAFLKLQQFGENVKLPKKKKGHLIKDINDKLINIHKKFNTGNYTINDFKKKFQEIYPEAFDIYTYEKGNTFESWIESVIQHSPRKKLKNIYQISIIFNYLSNKNENILTDKIPYIGFVNEYDEIKISTHSIFIKAERNAIYSPKHILDNETNTIHTQIIKALIVYYFHIGKYIEIKSINITREKTKILDKYSIPNDKEELEQVLPHNYSFLNACIVSSKELSSLFKTDDKSIALFNATSYVLKGIATKEPSEKFEKLWKAFNSIYRYIGQSKNDNECHIKTREFLLNNQSLFLNCKNIAQSLTKEILRDKIRFRDLILNDYETKELTVSFIAFIYRYSDSRIANILFETLVYRDEFLKDILSLKNVESKFNKFNHIRHLYSDSQGQHKEYIYDEIIKYLQTHITNNIENDMEIIAFICIKYGYYIRNKIFHAEKYDLSFRFIKSKQLNELDWLNEILTTLVLELIYNNDKW